jgi:Fur family transcriptional regulator, ferric uptake regulator
MIFNNNTQPKAMIVNKLPSPEFQLKEILKRNDLSITTGRKKILELFLKKETALSHSEIEKNTGDRLDRVTIYRTLMAFVEKGILHTIPTDDNSVKYALCKNDCGHGHHHDDHVHFVCDRCGNTQCLEGVLVPGVALPHGFKPSQSQMVVKGFCDQCQ